MPDRVLLIGKRAVVLTRLQAALRESGIEADLTQDTAARVAAGPGEYDAVAFGRAVGEHDRARMRDAFRAANHAVAFVDGLAPITPLLKAQFEQALGPEHERRLGDVTVSKVESSSSFAHRPQRRPPADPARPHAHRAAPGRAAGAGDPHGRPQATDLAIEEMT